MTFGVVLLTLLVQATTLKPLISQLGIVARTPVELAYQKTLGELISVKAAKQKLLELHQSGAIPQHTWETLNPEVSHQESQAAAALQTLIETEPSVQNDVIATTRRDLLVARRGALHSLNRDGLISEEIFEELVVQVDSDLDRLEFH
ncbi:MAG: hypothetical protein ACE5G8_15045 [Anaerolineae bacterium]